MLAGSLGFRGGRTSSLHYKEALAVDIDIVAQSGSFCQRRSNPSAWDMFRAPECDKTILDELKRAAFN